VRNTWRVLAVGIFMMMKDWYDAILEALEVKCSTYF